ncbi:MAG: hypothetical protein QOD55_2973 [Solirubrobacteraceae bacterium]|jgi:hypothetical protein|nr:hypothetical protein [Solirubrobacteraceae bacterium]
MNATLTKTALAVVALAALSLLAPSQPGYDPWAWLIWGREVAGLDLDTVDGPAWKPLPVAVTAVLSVAGSAAPALWLVVARAGALAAVVLAGRVAWRLAGGSRIAAVVAAAGVALSAGWAWHGAVGNSEGLFLALALAALDQALSARHGRALGLAFAAALLRPESWPFLGVYGVWLWWRRPALRPALAAAAAALPALWFVPELLGSGDLLRSSERARIPNPGAPATDDRPALASLRSAAAIPLAPLALMALAALGAAVRGRWPGARAAALPAAAGLAWLGVVAVMAESGYSGEPRYALPGAAALAVSGGAALALALRRAPPAAVAAALLVVAAFAGARLDGAAGELRRAADDARLFGSLGTAVARAGGPAAVLGCGRPVVGPYRGPALAWALHVPKRRIAFDPAAGGMVFRSRVRPQAAVQPPAPARSAVVARAARWEVRAPAGCRGAR